MLVYLCGAQVKRIDAYLIKSFLPPFVATFFIALFVLILQILWVYIDDIIGKGSSLLFILEMVFYLSMSLIPLALPIGVLISSVMVLGNLAERYELSSFKSAGVSLARVMLPLVLVVSVIASFSFVCSNYLIPIANLKGKARLYDVRKQKPNLNLEAGVFNEDFEGFVIYVGSKSDDGDKIHDVMLYANDNARMFQVITAKDGRLYTTPDDRFLVMELEKGFQYQEMVPEDGKKNRPFLRSSFGKWEKRFDLGQFDLERTDEGSFRSHSTVLTLRQIGEAMDSLGRMRAERIDALASQSEVYLPLRAGDSTASLSRPVKPGLSMADRELVATLDKGQPKPDKMQERRITAFGELSFLETFSPSERNAIQVRARTFARSLHGEAISAGRALHEYDKAAAKYILEGQMKFSLAAMCLIFLFIGAPMGAIVRKGGFGYPLLIAIVFFMVFMVLNMTFKGLSEKLIVPARLGAWVPAMVLFPVGIFLTHRAMIDAQILDLGRFAGFFARIRRFMPSKRKPVKERGHA